MRVSFLALIVGIVFCGASSRMLVDRTPPDSGVAISAVTTEKQCSLVVTTRGIDLRTHGGYRLYVENPQVVPSDRGWLVIGSPSFASKLNGAVFVDETSLRHRTVLAGGWVDSMGPMRPLPAPSGVARMIAPRVIRSPQGRIALLWNEADSMGRRYEDSNVRWSEWIGTEWTVPERIRGIPTARWQSLRVSDAATIDGVSTLVVGALTSSSEPDIAVRWEEAGWIARPWTINDVTYVRLTAMPGDSVRLLVAVDYANPDGNTVFLRRSTTRSPSWEARVRIGKPGEGAAYSPTVVPMTRDSVAIVWLTQDNTGHTAIRIALSGDGGRSWRETAPYTSTEEMDVVLAATATANGVIHTIVTAPSAHGLMTPRYLTWYDGSWSQHRIPEGDRVTFGTPAIAAISTNAILGLWQTAAIGVDMTALETRAFLASAACNTSGARR
jgi:hypothetical protein